MSWLNVDDQFARHPKMVAIGPLGLALQVRALCYCAQYLTDGFLPEVIAKSFTIDLPGQAEDWLQKMVAHQVWQVQDGGFLIHDYLVYNRSKKQIEMARKLKSRGGQRSQQNQQARRYAQSSASSYDESSLKHSPLPLPQKKENKVLINPTSTSVSHRFEDRETKGFELASDSLSNIFQKIAEKMPE